MSIGGHHNPVALKDEWLTPQHGEGAFFILKDCRDLNTPHLCLFPEFLKHELREIRSTIEAYSQAGKMGGAAEASACGLKITKVIPEPEQRIVICMADELGGVTICRSLQDMLDKAEAKRQP